jgi:hypothetical protein
MSASSVLTAAEFEEFIGLLRWLLAQNWENQDDQRHFGALVDRVAEKDPPCVEEFGCILYSYAMTLHEVDPARAQRLVNLHELYQADHPLSRGFEDDDDPPSPGAVVDAARDVVRGLQRGR